MSLYLPEELRWLGWIAGSTWPDGDEDAMWAIAAAWKTASEELQAQLSQIDAAKQQTMLAYPQGAASEAMGRLFDGLRNGDQSLESLAQLLQQISDSTFDLGTQLQATKLTIIISLCWLAMEILWAWLFPPTAPVVEAAAVSYTRSFLRVFEDMVQNAITRLARKLGASAEKRYFWKSLAGGRFVLPTAKGWGVYTVKFGESALTSGGLNAAVQLGQMADGKRRHFDGKEFGVSVFASVASTLPSREFARYLGRGIDKFGARSLDNVWGRTGRGAFIGAASGVVGSATGNLAVGVATGDWSSFASPTGWVGGIARGGLVGGARGAFAKSSPISSSDVRYPLWMHKPGAPRSPASDAASRGGSSVHDGSSRGSGGSSIPLRSLNGSGGTRAGSATGASAVSGGQGAHGDSQRSGSGGSRPISVGEGSVGSGAQGTQGGSHSAGSRAAGSSGDGSSHGTGPARSVTESAVGSQQSQPSVRGSQGAAVHPADGTSVRGETNSRASVDGDGRSVHSDGRGTLDSEGRSFHTGHTGRGTVDSDGQSFHTARDSFHSAQESLGSGQSVHGSTGGGSAVSGGSGQPSVHGSAGGGAVVSGGGSQSSVPGSTGGGSAVSGGNGQPSVHGSAGGAAGTGGSGQASVHGSNSTAGSSGRNGFVPPTSWQASVDGGWRPPSSHGSVVDGSAPAAPGRAATAGTGSPAGSHVPGGSVPGGSVQGGPAGQHSNGSGGSSSAGSSITDPPSGRGGSTQGGGGTNNPGTQVNPGTGAQDPFLGPGKDMKSKTRPKQLPHWAPLPRPFHGPEAPDDSVWVLEPTGPDNAEPGGGDEKPPVDVPFKL
ncbi:WXG100-like domain-containing protein [Nocardia brasiliensis]|uniref:WXG100-like domain-containing protein n=1 Tax=Nocardia brasiliensis TaxID=37326 RepID=UPI0004A77E53|nr:WXG100 family type VII secretion target [Nocardia brasiliensis]